MNEEARNWRAALIVIALFLFGQAMLFLLHAGWQFQVTYAILFAGVISAGYRYYAYVFIFRVVTPVCVGFSFMLAYEYAYSIPFFSDFLDASFRISFHIERFFEVLSVMYAITIAFLLWKGLNDHDALKQALNEEANIIRSIIDYTFYFGSETNKVNVSNIKHSFKKYIENILVDEKIKNNRINDNTLRECAAAVSRFKIEDENDKIALSEIMKQISNLNSARSRRQSYIETAMSPYLLFALLIMSLSIIYPFFTRTPTEGGSVAYSMIFIMSTLLSFMFITMMDISRPFAGFWKIKTTTFEQILEEIDEEPAPSEEPKTGVDQPA